jgi:broad specificity phosphatase PhoE
MQTRLILIRHGASHHKEDAVVGGPHGCRGLTDLGRRQAIALAQRLAAELSDQPAAVYTSVIPRAIETAEIVATALGRPDVTQDCGLCTWHTPAHADGKPWADYRRESSLTTGGVYRPFEAGNESWSQLVARVGGSMEQIAARHAGATTVVVAHAETVNAALIVFGALPLALGFDTTVGPTSITEWTTTGDPTAWPRPR